MQTIPQIDIAFCGIDAFQKFCLHLCFETNAPINE